MGVRRYLLCCVMGSLWSFVSLADEVALLPLSLPTATKETLQRGAQLFMNYCSGCHSLRYLRYNQMGYDLGLTTFAGDLDRDLLMNNLIFTTAKVDSPIDNSMPAEDARQWFGRVPPDLSLTAKERGASWIYTYLKSFYADQHRPFGANNLLVPDVGMPNVLAPLQGRVIRTPGHGDVFEHLLLVHPGEMSPQQFDSMLQDLVTFLVYTAEPMAGTRYRMGVAVMLFLCCFLVVAYALKRTYWKK